MIWKAAANADNKILPQGVLEVVVEGQVLGQCEPSTFPAGQFTRVSFPLPPELVKTKDKVEVLLRVPGKSRPVSGVYECRIVVKS